MKFKYGGYNEEAFLPEDVEKGLHIKFIKALLQISSELSESYYDIHITTDSYCTIVQWCNHSCDGECGGSFEYVDEDKVIAEAIYFPNGTTMYAFDEEEKDNLINEFIKEHPEWEMNKYGTWKLKQDEPEYSDEGEFDDEQQD